MRFAGKTVVLCVTGGIAAYKAADLTSKLHQNGATVHVLMTESATQFIAPMTFETLSGNRAVVDTFDRSFPWEVEHISLAKAADVFVIAPGDRQRHRQGGVRHRGRHGDDHAACHQGAGRCRSRDEHRHV